MYINLHFTVLYAHQREREFSSDENKNHSLHSGDMKQYHYAIEQVNTVSKTVQWLISNEAHCYSLDTDTLYIYSYLSKPL